MMTRLICCASQDKDASVVWGPQTSSGEETEWFLEERASSKSSHGKQLVGKCFSCSSLFAFQAFLLPCSSLLGVLSCSAASASPFLASLSLRSFWSLTTCSSGLKLWQHFLGLSVSLALGLSCPSSSQAQQTSCRANRRLPPLRLPLPGLQVSSLLLLFHLSSLVLTSCSTIYLLLVFLPALPAVVFLLVSLLTLVVFQLRLVRPH